VEIEKKPSLMDVAQQETNESEPEADKGDTLTEEWSAPSATVTEDSSAVLVIPRVVFNYVVIAGVFLILGVAIGVLWANNSAASNRALIEQSVAAAVEAQAELIAASTAPSLDDPNSRFTVSADDDPFIGPEDAPIVIIEFSDFNCGYCKRFFTNTLQPILDTYGDSVRFTYRDYPILSESSLTAALAAQCANEQGKFWEFHNILFDNQGDFGRDALVRMAGEVGADTDTFAACLDDQKYMDEVVADYRDAQRIGIRGTPAFFINGRPISGAQGYQVFADIIEQELEAASAVDQPDETS
jgi:protein-disulfide isomerase